MSIRIEITKIKKENGEFSIWIDGEQRLDFARFIDDISLSGIDEPKTVYQSFGPAETIEKFTTEAGDFYVSREFDEFAGTTIYSDNPDLMDTIYQSLLASGNYRSK